MRAWVFNEAALQCALDSWITASTDAGDPPGALHQAEEAIMDFLKSPQAAKLRVGELDKDNVRPAP